MTEYCTLITATTLSTLITTGSDLVVLDCRTMLGDAHAGPAAWAKGHIAGAMYANLDTQLAAPPHSEPNHRGGRHPLPDRAQLIQQCGAWGIGEHTQVVAYDDASGAYAARAWWLLRWLGHRRVAVLNGGLKSWTALPDGKLVSAADAQTQPTPTRFIAQEPLTRIASLADVEAVVTTATQATNTTPTTQLIDARAKERFDGKVEPIDPVAGHIPSAHCLPLTGNLNSSGEFLAPAELARRFQLPDSGPASGENFICYCGSGVTAAHNVLAICHAGLAEPRLYIGSWSEWSADPSRAIA